MNSTLASASVHPGKPQPAGAAAVASLQRGEVIPLAREELKRFLALLETLSTDDWQQPTECSLWNVHDIVAHQASHVLALTRPREFLDQFFPLNFRDYTRKGMNSLDAANQRQVDLRSSWTPAQLIGEMREHSEASFAGRQRFPFLLRSMRVRTPGYDGLLSIGELIDSIFTRDMWMHRLDICRATGRDMLQTAEHDGRITALVVRDLDAALKRKLGGRAVVYSLTGASGGEWVLGGSQPPEAEIRLDALDFHRVASGRISGQQALEQHRATIDGDSALGRQALQNTVVLY